jgi:CubicO group peptidase (beta-lactamase class C family)
MNPLMRAFLVALATSVLLPCLATAGADAAAADNPFGDLDGYVERARAARRNVGVSIAVVQGTEVLYVKGFGLREFGRDSRIDADTLFQIGSTTKAFTTAALGMLVDEGKLRWDDPVIDHLPGFRLQDPWLTRNLTVRDAVTHRSGIPDNFNFVLSVMDQDEALRQLRYIAPAAAFRDSYNYSNLMYGVAGQIVQAASGMTWREFVQHRLFEPLQMRRSGTSAYEFWDARHVTPTYWGSPHSGHPHASDARDSNVAMPHAVGRKGAVNVLAWESYDNAAGAGALVSTAADMAKWLILQLNEGSFAGRQLLQPQTVRTLHSPQNLRADASSFPFDDAPKSYALGWNRAQYRGLTHLAHTGGMVGFPAYVALLPERKLGVVVLANSLQAGRGTELHKALGFWIFDRLLGAPQRDWSREYLGRAEADARAKDKEREKERAAMSARLVGASPSLPLSAYAGDYEDREHHSGRVRVRMEDGKLMLRFNGEGAFSGWLEPHNRELFELHPNAVLAAQEWEEFPTFTIDPHGRVAAMTAFNARFDRVPAGNDDISELASHLDRIIAASGATVGVSLLHLESGRRLSINGEQLFPTASTVKVAIAAHVLKQVDEGKISLDRSVSLQEHDVYPATHGPISQFLHPGSALTTRDLLHLMLMDSDNNATDILLRVSGGPSAVTARMRSWGLRRFRNDRTAAVLIANFLGRVDITPERGISPSEFRELVETSESKRVGESDVDFARRQRTRDEQILADERDKTTPRDMAELLEKIWSRKLLSPTSTELLLGIMAECITGENRLKGLLPQGVRLAHKTGTIGYATNDVGIMELPGGAGHVALAVYTKASTRESLEQREAVLAQIGLSVYHYFFIASRGP